MAHSILPTTRTSMSKHGRHPALEDGTIGVSCMQILPVIVFLKLGGVTRRSICRVSFPIASTASVGISYAERGLGWWNILQLKSPEINATDSPANQPAIHILIANETCRQKSSIHRSYTVRVAVCRIGGLVCSICPLCTPRGELWLTVSCRQ